jgi:ABC-type Fe3+ transport system permease subunit
MRSLLRFSLGLFFLSPFLIWLCEIKQWSGLGNEWIAPLYMSLWQSLLSALGAVFLGGLMALGALSIRSPRGQKRFEYWLLVPNLIPQIFLILALLNMSSWWPWLAQGLPAIIIAHVLLNSGLVALAFLRLLGPRLSGFLDLAVIEGAGRGMIWFEVILPALKNEILFLFLFVFSISLTSFAIPLMLGGPVASNLEVLIFDTLRIHSDWSRAILYAIMQMSLLFAFAWFIPKPTWSLSFTPTRWHQLGVRRLLIVSFLPSLLLLFGWLSGVFQAMMNVVPEKQWLDHAFVALVNTFAVAFGAGFLTLILCLWVSYVWPHRSLSFFMKGYLTPSSAVTGFAFLLLPGVGGDWPILKMIIALTLISFPLLFRWMGQAALESLEDQIVISRTLGASWSQILFEIIWPQRGGIFLRMSGLCALWASGDFAVSSIIAEGDRTWALLVDGLIGNYRLDLASLLTVPLIAIGLLCYGFFLGAARYVTR